MSNDITQMQAELARLRAENEALKQANVKALTLKVGESGTISVYGLGRYPVSLYSEQWERLLAIAPRIQSFAKEHAAEIVAKQLAKQTAVKATA